MPSRSPYNPKGQTSGFGSLATAPVFSTAPLGTGTGNIHYQGQYNRQQFDTKVAHGATDTREQFKGLPATGFTPGANEHVGGSLMFQQRLRLMFLELVQQGMSHKDAAVHIQKTTGFHARTGQKLVAKTEHKKHGIKYAGQYLTKKHYKGVTGRSGHHRPRHPSPLGTPAGLK